MSWEWKDDVHTVYQSTTHAIFYYIHTYTHTYLYKIIKHTFEKKNMPSCLWESNHVGTPFLFWGPRFFKPMGSQDPVFLTPSANTDKQFKNILWTTILLCLAWISFAWFIPKAWVKVGMGRSPLNIRIQNEEIRRRSGVRQTSWKASEQDI